MDKNQLILSELLPFWKDIDDASRQRLSNEAVHKRFTKGEILHAGKDDCTGLFLIQSGRVRAYILTDEGKEVTLFRLLERDICIFSASCIMKDINFDIYISAETHVEAIRIPPTTYMDISNKQIAVSNYTNQIMSSRMSDVMWVLEQILFMSFDKRLALFLLEQANLEGSDILSITHEQIAGHMGSAREVVSRMLKYFVKEQMITMTRGAIVLTDKERLKTITE